ncbi:MAG: HAMP domain-containing histidine kinase [Bdellovibrionaceae bacterium]|nr:HAMP domain-containing histidine kinase [Pseudobdellovibrionaceae bacterium]
MNTRSADLKAIFHLESYEDFLQYFVKKLLKKKNTQAYLLYTDFKWNTNLIYFQNKKIHTEMYLDKKFSFSKNIQIKNDSINGVFNLANQSVWSDNYGQLLRDFLKRPVLPLVVIPFLSPSCVLCLEDSEGELAQSNTQNNFFVYHDCLSKSLLQIQEQNKLAFFSFLWEQSFEKNMDPMLIENSDSVLIKENEIFKTSLLQSYYLKKVLKQKEEEVAGKKYQEAAVIKLEDHIYEPSYYNIKTTDNDWVRFCHYKDISKILLLREDLLQRKKMEALGGLANQLSNQLNNPLAGIRGLVQILQPLVAKNKKLLDSLNEVESETWRCRSIIENLKNFSNKNNSIEVFDLNQLVIDVIALSKVALSRSAYLVNLEKNILNIKGSRQLIQQVIFNIIINAIQAISAGDKITISSFKKGKSAILEIKDYGKGMSKHIQSQIFTPFFTTKKNQGTGLGLSMSLNIMKKFLGTITVDSVEGKYTAFFLSFPLVDGESKG